MWVICLNRRYYFQCVVVVGLDLRILARNIHILHLLSHCVHGRRQGDLDLVHGLPIQVHLRVEGSVATTCILHTHQVAIVIHVSSSLVEGSLGSFLVIPLPLVALTLELALVLVLG